MTYAVLLAGGKGTRLWPLSTENRSKAFIGIGKRRPLITETVARLRGFVPRENMIVVVDKAQAKLVKNSVKGFPRRNVIVEPFGRSTASSIGLAAVRLKPDDIMAVLPTDAMIQGAGDFRSTLKAAVEFTRANENVLMCVGILPRGAETAYGYIKLRPGGKGRIRAVDKFMEKPTEKRASRFVKDGNYLWNAGIFIFKADSILEAMRRQAPLLYRELLLIKKDRTKTEEAYGRMKNISIDYQIMEKVKNLYCAKGNFSWRDLGNWKGIAPLFKRDMRGNNLFGRAKLVDTKNSIVYNSTGNKLGVIGIKDTIVVHTKNGTLVCGKKDAEKVKKLAGKL
jgi:mannose-1-phosphate guanylyltransferase